MSSPLELARQLILAPAGLAEEDLSRLLAQLHGRAIDSADLYFQANRHESWVLEDGIVKEGRHGIDRGAGVRAVSGEKTGFAYSDELVLPALLQASQAASAIARAGRHGAVQAWQARGGHELYAPLDPVESLGEDEKVRLLQRLDAEARKADPRITQVIVSLAGSHDVVLVAASDGTLAADVRPLVRLNVSVIASAGGRREQGSTGGGGRVGYEWFLEEDRALDYAREAVRQAVVNLEAEDAPAGTMTVVLGPGWPGVLLHEAVGHGLEGDFNRKGTSAFAGLMGQRIAAPGVTVLDDGTIPDRRGSISIDDEGTPSGKTVLIEDGILVGYMQDRQNARLMGVAPTGNGRRESYAHAPMPRMTNTYMLGGDAAPADILADLKDGIYAVGFGGGQVDITNGKFVFSCTEAYRVQNGKIGAPVKGATLIGDGATALQKIRAIGNDMALDPGMGNCGKAGQWVPVGVGQPTLMIGGLTVGGSAT
jgi:TldD protein